MKKTRFFKPYIRENKCTLKRTGSGVYLIEKKGDIVYVGMSYGNVKKTLYRHFQKWTDKRSAFLKDKDGFARVSYCNDDIEDFRVRVIFTNTGTQAEKLEQYLIKKHKPIQNNLKLYLLSKDDEKKLEDNFKNNTFTLSVNDDDFFNISKHDEPTPF